MIITKTPFRISFFGSGTDHPEWFKQHGGKVLATTFDVTPADLVTGLITEKGVVFAPNSEKIKQLFD